MKYCKNCGAKLDDDAAFCHECGAKQSPGKTESEGSKLPKKNWKKTAAIIIGAAVLAGIGIGIYFWGKADHKKEPEKIAEETAGLSDSHPFSQEETSQKPLDLKERMKWGEDSKKIEELKLADFMDKPIGKTMNTQTSVLKWQCASDQGTDYLLCTYVYEEKEATLIFYKDIYNNVNVAEYSLEGQKQDRAEMEEAVEAFFKDREFSAERTGFFSNGKWAMEIVQIDTAAKTIGYYSYWWDFQNQRMEQSETDLKTLNILDADIMGDDNYQIRWNGNDSFTMKKYDCEILFNDRTIGSREGRSEEFWESGAGEFKRIEKPQNIPVSELEKEAAAEPGSAEEIQGVRLPQLPPEGRYWESAPLYSRYYIDISNVQDDRFDFEIYQAQSFDQYGEASDYMLVFKHHTAVFKDPYHAVYEGQNYTLRFECGTNAGYITVSGFNEVIPDGSTLSNTQWLGVS